MDELLIILNRNIGEEVCISANYIDIDGKIEMVGKEWVKLKIDKKKVKHIKIESIYAIEERVK